MVMCSPFAVLPVPASGSGQLKLVGGCVATGPFGHDVVDDGALVFGGRRHRGSGGACDVNAVQERIRVKMTSKSYPMVHHSP
jgi:hypothetical protein